MTQKSDELIGLESEWGVLHADNEKYERYALIIKLCAIIVSVLFVMFSFNILFSAFVIIVLWGQEAIWKTFQSRLCDRLLLVEKAVKSYSEQSYSKNVSSDILPDAFQLYSEWVKNKPAMSGLIVEYIRQGLKPTVIYPYGVLLVLVILFS